MPAKQQTKMKRKLAESEDSEESVGITRVAAGRWKGVHRAASRPKPSETDRFVPQ